MTSIRLGLEAHDWKEAVKVAVDPLIESGAILPEYYDAIIESTGRVWPVPYLDARYGYAPR